MAEMIDDTYTIRTPGGGLHDVNIFEYNLKHIVDGHAECEDGCHVKARRCEIVRLNREHE